MKKKRIFKTLSAAGLSLVMFFGFVGCSKGSKPSSEGDKNSSSSSNNGNVSSEK